MAHIGSIHAEQVRRIREYWYARGWDAWRRDTGESPPDDAVRRRAWENGYSDAKEHYR